ncbi:MAG TPA: TylF/MycF/NovP-related O-methyltransferase [Opitutaceae bacterium]|jgi:O-methyltransferase
MAHLFSPRLFAAIRPAIRAARALCPPALWQAAYKMLTNRGLPDADRYGILYQPWREPAARALYRRIEARTLVSPESCWHLSSRLRQSQAAGRGHAGAVYELGVYKGGTARLLREGVDGSGDTLRLFDTFAGMERVDPALGDRHRTGDFSDTSLDSVRAFVGSEPFIDYRVGWVPRTFGGIEADAIKFAHVDLDLHDPILASCEFIYPRLVRGGALVFDDYGFPSTAGARRAIDAFFRDKPEVPFILQSGQAIVVKL